MPETFSRGTLASRTRLRIGKNYQGDTALVQSIFRLAVSDEDGLTFALGYLLAYDPILRAKLVRHFDVATRRHLQTDYSVHVQEVTDPKFGRRDIVIRDGKIRIVLEAKIGDAEPTSGQLLKYAAECNLWNKLATRAVDVIIGGKGSACQSAVNLEYVTARGA